MSRTAIVMCTLALALGLWAQEARYRSAWDLLRGEYDRNADGQVTAEEYPRGAERFQRLDRNRDGVLTAADFEGARRGSVPGRGGARRRAQRGAPAPGVVAPDFTLPFRSGDRTATLSSFRGKKPVALIFGSYT